MKPSPRRHQTPDCNQLSSYLQVPPSPQHISATDVRGKKRQALEEASCEVAVQALPPDGNPDANRILLGVGSSSYIRPRNDLGLASLILVDDIGALPSALAVSSPSIATGTSKKTDATEQAALEEALSGFVMVSPWNEKKRRLLQAAKFDGVQVGGPERRPDTKFGDHDREAGSNNNEDTCDVPLQMNVLLHPCSRPLPSQSTLFMMPLNWSNCYAPRMEGTFHASFDFGNTLTLCAI
jgi:hypothetical protein